MANKHENLHGLFQMELIGVKNIECENKAKNNSWSFLYKKNSKF